MEFRHGDRIDRIMGKKIRGDLKGRIIPEVCEHSFICLSKEQKKEAVEINKFRYQCIPLWRCTKCGGYTWSM